VEATNTVITTGSAQDDTLAAGATAINITGSTSGGHSAINLTGGKVVTYGKNNVGLNASRAGIIRADGTKVIAHGDGSKLVDAWHPNTGPNAADAPSKIFLTNGVTVTAYGDNSFGLDAAGVDASVHASNTTITMKGANSFGAIAKDGGTVTIDGSTI